MVDVNWRVEAWKNGRMEVEKPFFRAPSAAREKMNKNNSLFPFRASVFTGKAAVAGCENIK